MSSYRSRGGFAAGVSRALHKQGLTILPSGTSRMREGVRVSGFSPTSASVVVDLDTPNAARRLADDVVEALQAAGYRTERTSDNIIRVERVTREAE